MSGIKRATNRPKTEKRLRAKTEKKFRNDSQESKSKYAIKMAARAHRRLKKSNRKK